MVRKNETLDELNARHARVAWAAANAAKKKIEDIMDRAKEHLFVLRGRHAVDVAQWQLNERNKPPMMSYSEADKMLREHGL